MPETLECSSGSADWIIAVGTVGSIPDFGSSEGLLPAVLSHSMKEDDHSSPARPHSFKSREGLVALWEMSCMVYLHLYFQRPGVGWGGGNHFNWFMQNKTK